MWNTVLFDLDGTLTDSGEGITRCVQYALRKEFGIKVENLHDLDCFVGPPLKEQFMQYAHLNAEEAERAIMAYRERYRTRGIYENRVYDGIPEVLSALAKEGMVLGLASSKPTEFCREILRYFGLEQYFRVIVGSEMNGRRSKKTEVIEDALLALGMTERRAEVVLVGDRKYDVEGAKLSGISSIGVSFGYGSRAELEATWPDCIVDTPEELRNVLIGQARDAKADGSAVCSASSEEGQTGYPANWGTSSPWVGYYGAPQGYYFPPQGYGVPQGTEPPQGYYVPKSYPLPGYNYPPQGYYLPSGSQDVRIYDPQSAMSYPAYGQLAAPDCPVPARRESIPYMLWRILYPLLLDYATSFVVTNLLMVLFVMIMGNASAGYEVYQRNSLLVLGLSDLAAIVLFSILFYADHQKRLREGVRERILKCSGHSVVQYFIVAVFSFAVGTVITLVISTLPLSSGEVYDSLEQSIGSANVVVRLLVVCISGPVAEELLFRGILYRRLRDYMGTAWAAVFSAVIFGVAHGDLYQGLYAGIFGLVLALIYEHYGTLWICIFAHVVNNLSATFFNPMFSKFGDLAQTLYIVCCVVLTVVLGIVIFSRKRRINAV